MPLTESSDGGYGCTITFQSGLCAQITDLSISSLITRKTIEFPHMASTNGLVKKIVADLHRLGSMKVKLWFESHRIAAYETAAKAASETTTVTFPTPAGGATPGTIAAKAVCTDYGIAVPGPEDGMTAEVTIEFLDTLVSTSAT